MPQLQSPITIFAVNAANDTSPSGVTDQVTGQPIYIGDLNRGVYFDLTNEEAASMSDTLIGKLYAGRYRRVQVDSGATAANVKTGTIGLMPSLAAMSQDIAPVGVPTENVVTSYDQPIGNTAGGVRPVVFLNAITPGNFGFVQELGIATVLGRNPLTAAPAVGDVIVSFTAGVVDDPSQSTNPTYAILKTVLGTAIDLPVSNGLFRILLNLPVVQD
jgi:hypothetical protein